MTANRRIDWCGHSLAGFGKLNNQGLILIGSRSEVALNNQLKCAIFQNAPVVSEWTVELSRHRSHRTWWWRWVACWPWWLCLCSCMYTENTIMRSYYKIYIQSETTRKQKPIRKATVPLVAKLFPSKTHITDKARKPQGKTNKARSA